MKYIVLYLFVLTVITSSFGQTAGYRGKITDSNGQPLQSVSVRVLNTNSGAITNSNGEFTLLGVKPGVYTILFSAVGFASVEKQISITDGAEPLALSLSPSVAQLDDVIVTAQKTEEDIQRIPFSISAFSSRKADEYRLWNIKDVTGIVPNLYSANPGDNRNVTSIRGITSTSYDPAVATYIDGVNQFTLDTYIAQLFDVERIEVLRGPQGTLYGRNAMAGVINVITKAPTNDTRGFAEASFGNYGQQRYSLGVRTPLLRNKLFLGVAGLYDKNDGFYDNDFNNSDFDKKYNITGNYYLKYLPTDKLAITLNAKNSINRNDGAFPLAGSVEGAFEDPFKVNQNATTTLVDNVFNGSLNINHAGEVVNFTSLTTYQKNYRIYEDPIDGDFSPIDGVTVINNYGKDWNTSKVFTQEFKITSPASSPYAARYKWTAGTYLFYQKSPTKQATHFGEDAEFVGGTPFSSILNTSTGKSRGVAFYAQGTYYLSPKLEVTAGLRYDYERKKQQVQSDFLVDGVSEPVFVIQPDTAADASFSAVSPKISLAYHLKENSTLYITGSRGFRAGGLTQINPDPSQAPLYSYKPEYSFNVEAGVKNSMFNDKLLLNFTAYYIKVNDAQVPTLILPEALTVTRNAGELTSKGIELELSGKIAKSLQVDYSFGLMNASYDKLRVPDGDEEINLEGNKQIFTPAHTSMLALQYNHNFTEHIGLTVRGEWQNLGEQYFDLNNEIRQDSYSVLNARVGVAVKTWEVIFWGRNLGDEQYIAYAYDFGATHLGNPKNYGLTLRKSF